jgi:hypothetical protein
VVRLVTGADLCGLFVAQQVASGDQSAHVSVVGEDISADQLGKKMHQIRESCLFLEETKKTLRRICIVIKSPGGSRRERVRGRRYPKTSSATTETSEVRRV